MAGSINKTKHSPSDLGAHLHVSQPAHAEGGLRHEVDMPSKEYESWHRTGRKIRPNDDMTIWQAVVEVGPMVTFATLVIAAAYYAVVTVLRATNLIVPVFLLAVFVPSVEAADYSGIVRVRNLPVAADPPFYADVTLFATNYKAAPIQLGAGRVRITGDGNFSWTWYDITPPAFHDLYITVSGDGFNDGVWARVFDANFPGTVELYHRKTYSPSRQSWRTTHIATLKNWVVSE